MNRSMLIAALAIVPLACQSGGGASIDAFAQGCVTSANLSEEICRCIGTKAKEELSADGFAFLVASLEGNDERTAALREKLAVTEAIAAGTFMVSGPARCAQELTG